MTSSRTISGEESNAGCPWIMSQNYSSLWDMKDGYGVAYLDWNDNAFKCRMRVPFQYRCMRSPGPRDGLACGGHLGGLVDWDSWCKLWGGQKSSDYWKHHITDIQDEELKRFRISRMMILQKYRNFFKANQLKIPARNSSYDAKTSLIYQLNSNSSERETEKKAFNV